MDRKCHHPERKVSAVDSVAEARTWADILERNEARRTGLSRAEVRPIVARKTGVPASKLYSLWRNRLKDTGSWKEQLRTAVVRELEDMLRNVQHEKQIARQTGADPRDREMESLVASEAAIKTALGLPMPSPSEGEGRR
jgi:hypothetical protein